MVDRTARLDDPELLVSLSDALRQFEVSAQLALSEAQSAISATEGWLSDRRAHWEREVALCEEALMMCTALAAEAGGDCSWEEAALTAARHSLTACEQGIARFADRTQIYLANAPRLTRVVEQHCPAARAFLSQKGTSFGSYADLSGAATSSGAGGVAAGGRPAGAAANAPPSLVSYEVRGKPFADVPLSQIEEPKFAAGEWQQADLLDMQQSFARLPEIRTAIRNGTIEQLEHSDPAVRRVMDWFYGGEAVRLDWHQGKFTITNGKHRVALARQLGLSTLPATTWAPKGRSAP